MDKTSYLEINKTAYKNNYEYLKKRIGKKARFVSVIKGNAYGHGISAFLPMAEKCGVDFFAVFSASEARQAFKCKNMNSEIMIMGYLNERDIEWAITNGISFYIFSLNRLNETILLAKKLGKKAKIHLEMETGLNRTGFSLDKLEKIVIILKGAENFLDIEGICTHYAGAESVNNYLRIKNQIEKFNEMVAFLKSKKIIPKYVHSACSAATLIYPDTIGDLARIGIAQYGFWPSSEVRMHNMLSKDHSFKRDPLTQIISWKTQIMNLKKVKQGEFIGYGTSYMAMSDMIIASIPIGYSNGYSRALSNKGFVLIRGKKANVVGSINMNMLLVEVTKIPNVNYGDEVVLIGKQGDKRITVTSFTEISNYLNYELLTRIPDSVPRFIV